MLEIIKDSFLWKKKKEEELKLTYTPLEVYDETAYILYKQGRLLKDKFYNPDDLITKELGFIMKNYVELILKIDYEKLINAYNGCLLRRELYFLCEQKKLKNRVAFCKIKAWAHKRMTLKKIINKRLPYDIVYCIFQYY